MAGFAVFMNGRFWVFTEAVLIFRTALASFVFDV